MLTRLLPAYVTEVLSLRLYARRIYELRIRAGMPVTVNYAGRYYVLGKTGLTERATDASFVLSGKEVNEIIVRAAEYSLYAVNTRLQNGFLTIAGGIRIGVCGEPVYEGDAVKTVKSFSSLVIRVPHEVDGCSDAAWPYLFGGGVTNTLVAAPPGAGKTTVLRDIVRRLTGEKPGINVLVVDERAELAAVYETLPQLNVGNADIITGGDKAFAFTYGIRSVRPDVIVTDELMGKRDFESVRLALLSGVKVIASMHAATVSDALCRPGMEFAAGQGMFERILVLSSKNGPGTVEGVYDGTGACIWDGAA